MWDAASGKPLAEPMRHEEVVISDLRHKDVVNSAQFSPNGQRIVTASKDKTARVWDAASGKQIGEPMQHEDVVNSAQFSPDGKRVVTAAGLKPASHWDATNDKTARVWDADSGKQIGEPMRHQGFVSSAQFSPDGQRVPTTSGDGTARVWDTATATMKDTKDSLSVCPKATA